MNEPDPAATPLPGRGAGIALGILAAVAVLASLVVAKHLVMPMVAALLLTFLLRPVVRVMQQGLHVPRILGAALALATLLAGLGLLGWFLADPVARWLEGLPEMAKNLQSKLEHLRRPMAEVSQAAAAVGDAASMEAHKPITVQMADRGVLASLMGQVQILLADAGLAAILLFFLLSADDSVLMRVARALAWRDGSGRWATERQAEELIADTERQMSRYLLLVSLINAGLGIATGCAMALLGMPDPLLWGALMAFTNFVPYIGGLVVTVLVALAAVVSFDSVWGMLLPPLVLIALNLMESELVTPLAVSRRFELNPVAVVAWLALWLWLWGVIGGILAMPLLVLIVIVARGAPRLQPLAQLIAPEPETRRAAA